MNGDEQNNPVQPTNVILPDRRQVIAGGAAGTLAYLMGLGAARAQVGPSDPFIGSIMLVAFNFPPKGWEFCNGQLLAINQNQALFALLGTTYGGNGQTTFALPNLQGRAPAGFSAGGSGQPMGTQYGEATHTLITSEMPAHNHLFQVGATPPTDRTRASPNGNYLTKSNVTDATMYAAVSANAAVNALASAGGGQPHQNMQPYLVMNYVIATQGIFPSRS